MRQTQCKGLWRSFCSSMDASTSASFEWRPLVVPIRPALDPTTAKAIPQGDAWLHEPKLGGSRFLIDGRQLNSRISYETLRAASCVRRGRVAHPISEA